MTDTNLVQHRYSDEDLVEFKVLIQQKLEKAKNKLAFFLAQITELSQSDDIKVRSMDDGLGAAEMEIAQNMAASETKYVQNLEHALIRIDNKTYGSATSIRFRANLKILNPNNKDIHLEGINLNLGLNGYDVINGASKQEITLPALGEARMQVDLSLSLLNFLVKTGCPQSLRTRPAGGTRFVPVVPAVDRAVPAVGLRRSR